MKLKVLAAAIAGSFAISTAAMAADPIVIAPPPTPMVVAPAGFDWAGPYAGAGVIVPGFTIEGHAGFNFVRGNLIFGVEAMAGSPAAALVFVVGGSVRAGFLLGPTDRMAVYGTVLGLFSPGLGGGVAFGGGAALGLGDRLSVFGEVLYGGALGIRGGVNFHFGN